MADLGILLAAVKDEVAIQGERGLSLNDFWQITSNHQKLSQPIKSSLSALQLDAKNVSPKSYHDTPPLDLATKTQIISWIRADPDLYIQTEAKETVSEQLPYPRICASERAVWLAIAGHEKDVSRVPASLWAILVAIAPTKHEGILQPEVAKIVKQDPRSVGPRTHDLQARGYIVKQDAIAQHGPHIKTSRLTLKRFSRLRSTHTKPASAPSKDHASTTSTRPPYPEHLCENGTLSIEKFRDGVIHALKDARNQVLAYEDLKYKIGFNGFQGKFFSRNIKKLEELGCVSRIRIPLSSENTSGQATKGFDVWSGFPEPALATRYTKCVKFLKDWQTSDKTIIKKPRKLSTDSQKPGHAANLLQPIWQKASINHQIFAIVQQAGIEGIRGVELANILLGPFCYRPFEQLLQRLTENPLEAQPANLRHYAVLRDTDLYGRNVSYRFWTYENFLHNFGDAQPSLQTSNVHSKKLRKASVLDNMNNISNEIAEDENGFLPLDYSQFARDNQNVAECEKSIPTKKARITPTVILQNTNAKGEVTYKCKRRRSGYPVPKNRPPKVPTIDRPLGRPRKFMPGTEPYFNLEQRKASRQKAIEKGLVKEDECPPVDEGPTMRSRRGVSIATTRKRGRPKLVDAEGNSTTKKATKKRKSKVSDKEIVFVNENNSHGNLSSNNVASVSKTSKRKKKDNGEVPDEGSGNPPAKKPRNKERDDNHPEVQTSGVTFVNWTVPMDATSSTNASTNNSVASPVSSMSSVALSNFQVNTLPTVLEPPKKRGRPRKSSDQVTVSKVARKRAVKHTLETQDVDTVEVLTIEQAAPASFTINHSEQGIRSSLVTRLPLNLADIPTDSSQSPEQATQKTTDPSLEVNPKQVMLSVLATHQGSVKPKLPAANDYIKNLRAMRDANLAKIRPDTYANSINPNIYANGIRRPNVKQVICGIDVQESDLRQGQHTGGDNASVLPFPNTMEPEITRSQHVSTNQVPCKHVQSPTTSPGVTKPSRAQNEEVASPMTVFPRVDQIETVEVVEPILDPTLPEKGIIDTEDVEPVENPPTIATTFPETDSTTMEARSKNLTVNEENGDFLETTQISSNVDVEMTAPVNFMSSEDLTPEHVMYNGVELRLETVQPMKARTTGGIVLMQRKKIILEILKEHEGAMSLNKLCSIFSQQHLKVNTKSHLTDKKTFITFINSMVLQKVVKIYVFSSQVRTKVIEGLKIVLEYETSMTSPAIRKAIEDAQPAVFTSLVDQPFGGKAHMHLPVESITYDRLHVPQKALTSRVSSSIGYRDTAARLRALSQIARGRAKIPPANSGEVAQRTSRQVLAMFKERVDRRAELRLKKTQQVYEFQNYDADNPPPDAEISDSEMDEDISIHQLNSQNAYEYFCKTIDDEYNREIFWENITTTDSNMVNVQGKNLSNTSGRTNAWLNKMRGADGGPLPTPQPGELIMLNHFGPAGKVHTQIVQAQNNINPDFIIYTNDTDLVRASQLTRDAERFSKPRHSQQRQVPKLPRAANAQSSANGDGLTIRFEPVNTAGLLEIPKKKTTKAPRRDKPRPDSLPQHKEPFRPHYRHVVESRPYKPRRKRNVWKKTFNPDEDEKLLFSAIIIRTLFGGHNRIIVWTLVQTVLTKHREPDLRGRWRWLRDTHRHNLRQLQTSFQDQYLLAYERGELPEFDRSQPQKFPLEEHLEWFKANVPVLGQKDTVDLEGDQAFFESHYNCKTSHQEWRKDLLAHVLSMPGREVRMALHAIGVPRANTKQKVTSTIARLKSVMMSTIFTPSNQYDKQKLDDFWETCKPADIDDANSSLRNDKLMTKCRMDIHERRYTSTGRFHTFFATSHLYPDIFKEMSDYQKQTLVALKQDKQATVVPFLKDGHMAWLIDVIANQKVYLSTTDYYHIDTGLVDNYQTRGIDSKLYDFSLQIQPTALLLLESLPSLRLNASNQTSNTNFASSPLPVFRPPMGSLGSHDNYLHLWQNTNNTLNQEMWQKIVFVILANILVRSGSKIDNVATWVSPAVPRRDIEAIVSWLEGTGFLSVEQGCLRVAGDYWKAAAAS